MRMLWEYNVKVRPCCHLWTQQGVLTHSVVHKTTTISTLKCSVESCPILVLCNLHCPVWLLGHSDGLSRVWDGKGKAIVFICIFTFCPNKRQNVLHSLFTVKPSSHRVSMHVLVRCVDWGYFCLTFVRQIRSTWKLKCVLLCRFFFSSRKSVSATGRRNKSSRLFASLLLFTVWVFLFLRVTLPSLTGSPNSSMTYADIIYSRYLIITPAYNIWFHYPSIIQKKYTLHRWPFFFFQRTKQEVLILKMQWWQIFLQDSEESKGDYLSRTLRVTYRNVSSVYTLTVRTTVV